MSMRIGGATVTVVHAIRGGMGCDAFPSKLAAVLHMIDFGDLGGGIAYGGDEHKAALAEVEKQIAATRARIAEMEAEDAAAAGVGIPVAPRFQHTYCSQCGTDLGPGDQGVSSCCDHGRCQVEARGDTCECGRTPAEKGMR